MYVYTYVLYKFLVYVRNVTLTWFDTRFQFLNAQHAGLDLLTQGVRSDQLDEGEDDEVCAGEEEEVELRRHLGVHRLAVGKAEDHQDDEDLEYPGDGVANCCHCILSPSPPLEG